MTKTFLKSSSNLQSLMNKYNQERLKLFLIISIMVITVIKLNLVGAGFLAFPDEIRYCQSGKALQHFAEFKIKTAAKDIFTTQGRPAAAVINIIPCAIQYATAYVLTLNYYESKNSYPLFIFNFIIYCLILIVHFKFSKLLLKSTFLSLISLLLFGTLINSYLYLRHALPYDASLLILYLVVYKVVHYTEKSSVSCQKSLILGFCAFCGYLVYPGYFPLVMLGLWILFLNNFHIKEINTRLYYSFYYALGCVLCLVLFEKIARIVGTSYILDAIGLSKTITQGSFEESFTYILKYFYEVEGLNGIILLIGLLLFILIMAFQVKSKSFEQSSLIGLISIALLGMYLAYASAGYFLHKVVFYGRLLHQYIPFICIFCIYAINEAIKTVTNRSQLILASISMIFIVNFVINFANYSSYVYPRDILWQLINHNNLNNVKTDIDYDEHWPVMPNGSKIYYSDNNGKPVTSYYNIVEIGGSFGVLFILLTT